MSIKSASELGKQTGYDIAKSNIAGNPKLKGDKREKFISECLEAESDHFRQFSPFEFTAQEFNRSSDPERTWEAYENGVLSGIKKAVAEYNKR